MNDFVTRARNALERITANAEEGRHINGLLGRLNSDGSTTFTPVGLRNHKYVRIRNSSGSQTTIVARDDAGVPESSSLAVRLRVIHSVPNSGVVVYAIVGIVRDDALATMPAPPPGGVPAHIHDDRYFREDEHINVSVGAADAGKPIVLNADGLIDPSMYVAGSSGGALAFKFDSGTSFVDPGAGHIGLNNADPALAIGIRISDTDDNAVDVSTWLSVIASTSHLFSGYLHLWKRTDPTIFRVYGVLAGSGIDNTTYWSYTIVSLAGQGTFADEDDVFISHALSGDDGVHGGSSIRYNFSTTTTDSDPGSGALRFNHATFASVTQIFIDDNGYPNVTGAEAWIQTFDDSTSAVRGYLKITKITDQTIYRIFAVSGASVDGTGYWKIAVTPVTSQGSLADGDDIVVSFSRTGDKGDTGATGPAGDASDIAAEISGAATDDTIQDADLWGYVTGGVLVKTAWSNIKAVFKTYFDTLYVALTGAQTVGGVKDFTDGIKLAAGDTLDNYSSGIWSATITGSTGNPTVTYTDQSGRYSRIGNIVFYNFRIIINTYSGGSGDLRVSLPVTTANVGTADMVRAAISLSGIDVAAGAYNAHFRPQQGQSYGIMQVSVDNGVSTTIAVGDAAAGDTISAGGFYWV